jgi:hypothetical protein
LPPTHDDTYNASYTSVNVYDEKNMDPWLANSRHMAEAQPTILQGCQVPNATSAEGHPCLQSIRLHKENDTKRTVEPS